MPEIGDPRYVVGATSALQVWSGTEWIVVRGVKTVHPLVDNTDPENPTLGRIEMSMLPVVPASAA